MKNISIIKFSTCYHSNTAFYEFQYIFRKYFCYIFAFLIAAHFFFGGGCDRIYPMITKIATTAKIEKTDNFGGSGAPKNLMREKLFIATFSKDAVSLARDFGVGLEINHTCISQALDEGNRKKLLASILGDAKLANIEDSSRLFLHGPFTEIHPSAIDHLARELAMRRLNEAFEVASALRINRMVVHTGWLPFIYFKEWYAKKGAEFWEKFMHDKPAGFTIYIENVLEDEPYMLLDLMKNIENPAIRICLDVGHANAMTSAEIPVEKWIELLSPYIGHFHLHNNDAAGDSHGAFDDGSMDMMRILGQIDDFCAPQTTLTIEARDAKSCLEWLEANKKLNV